MTREYIIEAYEKLKTKLGRQPSQEEFYENTTVTAYSILKGGFRTYSQLVEEMGDTPKAFLHGGKTEEHFYTSYGNAIRQLNRIPSTQEWNYYKFHPALTSYKRKFNLPTWGSMAQLFLNYAKEKPEWHDIIGLIPQNKIIKNKNQEKESEECYVYFMYDTKSMCYKIGISNVPEWREKTLQSEKPSIKMIAAKKFVNRRIAANIEKALHESYSHKRKRGEWFQPAIQREHFFRNLSAC